MSSRHGLYMGNNVRRQNREISFLWSQTKFLPKIIMGFQLKQLWLLEMQEYQNRWFSITNDFVKQGLLLQKNQDFASVPSQECKVHCFPSSAPLLYMVSSYWLSSLSPLVHSVKKRNPKINTRKQGNILSLPRVLNCGFSLPTQLSQYN